MQEGTFTITNPGVFGSVIGTPIINQPQVGHSVRRRNREAAGGHHERMGRYARHPHRGLLSLSFDHRIVDGADADRFMAEVKKQIQEFPESAV